MDPADAWKEFAGQVRRDPRFVIIARVSVLFENAARSEANTKDVDFMADKGKGDKAKKETAKKPTMTLKEKRKAKNDKKSSK